MDVGRKRCRQKTTRALPDLWIRKEMTVVGLRTAWELRGRSCLDLELVRPDRKTLVRSRSFGERVEVKRDLREALAKHSQRVAEKLREEGLVAKGTKVFITTKRFGDPPHYSNGVAASLGEHTARGAPFVKASQRLLESIYRGSYGLQEGGRVPLWHPPGAAPSGKPLRAGPQGG